LEAVEQALEYLRRSLERAGFDAGAATYRRMTDLVISQFLWIREQGVEGGEAEFGKVSELAGQIHGQLEPYLTSMRRLGALQELIPRDEPDTLAGQVVRALTVAGSPLSVTAIRTAVDSGSAEVRKELSTLVSDGTVREVRSGSRVLFESAQSR
jgi:hypothetical protein